MLAAALVMAFYNVWSRPLIRRSGPISFTAVAMLAGAAALTGAAWLRGGHVALGELTAAQYAALIYLGIAGGAVAFFLWAVALARTTPTKVAISVTINPLVAALVGALLLSEAVSTNLLIGLALVLAGICLAASGANAVIRPQQASRNRSA
jgi:drug/metabolite transporter (DMT)-like permease